MFANLRRAWLKQLVLAAVLGAFLPVVSATVACQVGCVLADASRAEAGVGTNHDAKTEVSGDFHPGSHLQHAGACHMAAVAGLLEECASCAAAPDMSGWSCSAGESHASCIWPPPKHRPRTA